MSQPTNQEINKLIAESQGWLEVEIFPSGNIYGSRPGPIYEGMKSYTADVLVPDYCNDLNAIFQLEETIKPGETWPPSGIYKYFLRLKQIVEDTMPDQCYDEKAYLDFYTVHATARQRAIAFLQFSGKWNYNSDY